MQQPNKLGGFVQLPFDEARRELGRITGHVDNDGRLERVVRKCASPGCRAVACNGEPVTRASQAVAALDDPMPGRIEPLVEVDQAQQVIGTDRVIGGSVTDAGCKVLEIHARACRVLQFLGDGVEVFDGKRARERLVNQLGDGLAGLGQCFCEALHDRLLVVLGCRERQPDCHFLARTGLGRVATGERKLAIARQQDCSHPADLRVLRGTFQGL